VLLAKVLAEDRFSLLGRFLGPSGRILDPLSRIFGSRCRRLRSLSSRLGAVDRGLVLLLGSAAAEPGEQ